MESNEIALRAKNAQRKTRLDWYTKAINERWKSFAALFTELQADKLEPWLCEHESFEAYCRDVWGMTDRRRQQLAAGATVKTLMIGDAPDLAPIIEKMPEGQMRELVSAPADKRVEILREAIKSPKLKGRTIKQAKVKIIDAATGEPEEEPAPGKKTITLGLESWDAILEAAQCYHDEGPEPEGWQSDKLSSASAALQSSLEEAKAHT